MTLLAPMILWLLVSRVLPTTYGRGAREAPAPECNSSRRPDPTNIKRPRTLMNVARVSM
jgi:hypothetical protein